MRPSGSVEGGGFTIVPDMMSLVGCSGEDFQAILRSLDFRMHRKKVKVPKAEPATSAAEPSPTEAAEAAPPAEPPVLEESVEIRAMTALHNVAAIDR